MKKIITNSICLFILFISIQKVNAQYASGIPFTFTPGDTAISFPAGTTNIILVTRPTSIQDDYDTIISPQGGFSFNIGCTIYTKIILSTNGWLALAPSSMVNPPAYFSSALPNNSLSTYAGGLPLIAPLWDDNSCGLIQYNVTGNVLTVRWSLKWDKSDTAAYTAMVWASLNGNTGTITFNYSTSPYTAGANASASIGIAGVCPGDFYSVTPDSIITSSTIDSVTENTNVNVKPINARFVFTPYHDYDNCSNAKFLGTIDSICSPFVATTCNATTSGNPNCSTSDVNDVWFSYYKPVGVSDVYIETLPTLCASVNGTSMEVYSDSCGGNILGCAITSVSNPGFVVLLLSLSASVAETLFVRVTSDGDVPGKFQICAMDHSSLGINNPDPDLSFVIYPNPVKSNNNLTLKINRTGNENEEIEILNITGQVLFKENVTGNHSTYEFSTPKLSPGIYFVRMKSGNVIQNGKLIIE